MALLTSCNFIINEATPQSIIGIFSLLPLESLVAVSVLLARIIFLCFALSLGIVICLPLPRHGHESEFQRHQRSTLSCTILNGQKLSADGTHAVFLSGTDGLFLTLLGGPL